MITNWLPAPDARGPVTCDRCGCRLQQTSVEVWRHFPSAEPDQDARGCRPVCVDEEHDRFGHIIEAAARAH
jgi:hypothetical protein